MALFPLRLPSIQRALRRAAGAASAGALLLAARGADDPAALLRGEPQYARTMDERQFRREFEPYPVYFPPAPPPLGAAIDRILPLYDLKWRPPADLAPYVSEPFYPRLAMLTAASWLDTPTARRIDRYRDERLAQRTVLEQRLAELRDAPPAQRLAALETLALSQTPRLADLEREAERLRGDLASPLLLRSERERTRNRSRNEGRNERGRRWELEIVRNAAYFLDALLPAQRRLLCEAAMELDDRPDLMRPANQPPALPPLYFHPDTATIVLPPDLPAELTAKIAHYQTEKALAKRQLRDLLVVLDGWNSEVDAVREVRAFAQKQAPQLAALETRAEELRRELAPRWQARRATIPAGIARRLAAWHREQQAVDEEIVSRVTAAKKPLLTYTGQRNADILPRNAVIPKMDNRALPPTNEFQWLTGHAPSGRTRALYKVVHTALGEARTAFAGRIAALEAERAAIVQELARSAPTAAADGSAPGATALAYATAEFERFAAEHRLQTDYAGYVAAVFEPGLSPEQRRLLFDGAIEQLALPLPGGSFLPWPVVR